MTHYRKPDFWTETAMSRKWLERQKATILARRFGYIFWEHPIYGDEAPILACRDGAGPAGKVWNIQAFDVPTDEAEFHG